MKRKPNRPNAPLLSRQTIIRIFIVAFTMAATTLALYAIYDAQYGQDYARTIAFWVLVVMQWSNAFNARSDYESIFVRAKVHNMKFYIGLAIAVLLQILAMFGPLQGLLHVAPVSIGDVAYTGIVAFVIPLVVVEIHKIICRRFHLV